jgi:hypothetical protein
MTPSIETNDDGQPRRVEEPSTSTPPWGSSFWGWISARARKTRRDDTTGVTPDAQPHHTGPV